MSLDYTSQPFPAMRHLVLGVLNNHRPHTNYAVASVDITESQAKRQTIQRATRQAISFHAWAMYCLTRAAVDHPEVLTFIHGRRMLTYQSVDLATVIDRRLPDGVRIPVGWTLRGAEKYDLYGINQELRRTLKGDHSDDETVALRRKLLRLPGWLRRWQMRRIGGNPHLLRRYHGNIGLTNLQAPGLTMPFAPLPPNLYTLTLALGSISREWRLGPDGNASERQILHVVGAADHAVLDGAAMAAFSARLGQLFQSGYGLDDSYREACLSGGRP